MEKIYKEAKEFLHIHKTALFINACVCIICYGHLVFSQNIGIDTEHIINYPGVSMQWESIGRQGLLYTKRLFGIMEYNPYLGGVLFLGSFILLGSIIAFLCWRVGGKDNRYPYGWFLALFSACPVWMVQFYFSLQRAEVVMGMLYGAISVFALCEILFLGKRRVYYWYAVCLFFGVWCLASYQSCALLYIGLCITCYLMDFFRDPKRGWKAYLANIFGLLMGFAAVYAAYYALIVRTLANSYYLNAQIKWGEYPIMQSFSLIFDHIKCMLNWHITSDVSAFPLACICVSLLFCICVYKKYNIPMLFLGLFGLMMTPFLFSVYIGDKAIARTQFAQPLVCAAACMLFWGICRKIARKGSIWLWLHRTSMAAAAVILWICISLILQLEYTEDIRYREDSIVAQTIATDLGRIKEAKGKPIIFVGERKAKLNGASRPSDIYGYSFFQWDHSVGNPTGATWRVTGFMNALGLEVESGAKYRKKAIKTAEDMPCYPEEGYIAVTDKCVVIKMSKAQLTFNDVE